MSGTHSPVSGDNGLHFQAARNWLDRAEKQFSSGESVMAAATLMLAQAELKIVVEGVAGGTVRPQVPKQKNPFRLVPIGRDVIAVTALAACLVIGIVVGRAIAPSAYSPTPVPITIAQAPESPTIPPVLVPGPAEQPVLEPQIQNPDSETPASTPSPVIHRPWNRTPPPDEIGEPSPILMSTPSPAPVEAPAPVEVVPPAPAPSEKAIHPAEVALETIRALSERLLRGDINNQ